MAVKVAPLQEDAGADAWSIMDGKALDIEDLTVHSVIILEPGGICLVTLPLFMSFIRKPALLYRVLYLQGHLPDV